MAVQGERRYASLRLLAKLLARVFFRQVEVIGHENVPDLGPIVFCSNHPNALVDVVLLAAFSKRRLCFVAKDTLFRVPVLRELLHMADAVPVHRPIDDEGESSAAANETMFRSLYERLAGGAAVAIYPEGISFVTGHLNTLKTGAARTVLGTVDFTNGRVRPCVVPIGLTYSRPSSFRSRVLIQFGRPIVLSDALIEQHRADPGGAIRKLTAHITRGMERLTLNSSDLSSLRMAHTLRQVLHSHGSHLSFAQRFQLTQRFVEALSRTDGTSDDVRHDVDLYHLWLELCELSDKQLRFEVGTVRTLLLLLARTVALAAIFPVVAPLAALYLPVALVSFVTKKLPVEKEVVSTVKLGLGFVFSLFVYSIVAAVVAFRFGVRRGALALVALPAASVLSLGLFDEFVAAVRQLPQLWRLLWLRPEVEIVRDIRAKLRATARDLLHEQVHAADVESPGPLPPSEPRARL